MEPVSYSFGYDRLDQADQPYRAGGGFQLEEDPLMGWAWTEMFDNGGLAGSYSQSVQKSETIGWIVDVLRVWADVHELLGVTHGIGLKIEIEHAWNLLLSTDTGFTTVVSSSNVKAAGISPM